MPDVFAMGDFTAHVRQGVVGPQGSEELLVAARDCPVNAISVLPESGQVPKSGHSSDHHDEEGENEEKRGKVREYKREDSD